MCGHLKRSIALSYSNDDWIGSHVEVPDMEGESQEREDWEREEEHYTMCGWFLFVCLFVAHLSQGSTCIWPKET